MKRTRLSSAPTPLASSGPSPSIETPKKGRSFSFNDFASFNPVLITGPPGSGKSTTVNGTLGVNIVPTGAAIVQRPILLLHDPQASPGGTFSVTVWRYISERDEFECTDEMHEAVPLDDVRTLLSTLCGFYLDKQEEKDLSTFATCIVLVVGWLEPLQNASLIDMPGISHFQSEAPIRDFSRLFLDRLKKSSPKIAFVYDSGRLGPTELEGLFNIKDFIDPSKPESVLFFNSKIDFSSHYYDCGGKVTKEHLDLVQQDRRGYLEPVLAINSIFSSFELQTKLQFLASSALDLYIPERFYDKLPPDMNALRQTHCEHVRNTIHEWLNRE